MISVNVGVSAAPTRYPRLILMTSSISGGRQQLSPAVVSSSWPDLLMVSLPLFLKVNLYSSWLQTCNYIQPRNTGSSFGTHWTLDLPVVNPNLDQENDDERRREADGVQRGSGHRVGVVRPIDGLCIGQIAALVSALSLSKSGQTSSLQKNPFSCGFPARAKTGGGKFASVARKLLQFKRFVKSTKILCKSGET